MFELEHIAQELETILQEMVERQAPQDDDILVIGCSTSEVIGKRIGKAGSPEVAAELFPVLRRFAADHHLHLAFQCCEHLNRSLVVERETMRRFGLTEVSAVPHYHAGGSMSSHAYRHMTNPVHDFHNKVVFTHMHAVKSRTGNRTAHANFARTVMRIHRKLRA